MRHAKLVLVLLALTSTATGAVSGCNFKKAEKPEKNGQKSGKSGGGPSFPESSKELSGWVRTNTEHYWASMYASAGSSPLAPYLGHVGLVAGDPHIANFAPILATDARGTQSVRYVDVDYDDGGVAPLALDVTRLVVVSKATKAKVKAGAIVDAYLLGLRGQPIPVPSQVDKILKITVADYQKQADAYVNKKTEARRFILKPGTIEAYEGSIARAQLQALVPGMTILDVADRPHDHGSSEGDVRIYLLAQDAASHPRLFELKQRNEPAVSSYQRQPEMAEWFALMHDTFAPGIGDGSDSIVEIAGHGAFWLREKRVGLVDVPYSSEKKGAVRYVEAFAAYDANQLGLIHGRQPGGIALAKALATEGDEVAFTNAVKVVAKTYLNAAAAEAAKHPAGEEILPLE